MKTVTIKYWASVYVQAGWRSVEITAKAELSKTGKMATVLDVLLIDGEAPVGEMSRTGAKRQRFYAPSIAEREIGAKKRISSCEVI